MAFRTRLWWWWASSRSDWLVFGGLVALTGAVLVAPIMLACGFIALVFRMPYYLANLLDVIGGFSKELFAAQDWVGFRNKCREARAVARRAVTELWRGA